MEDRLLFIIGSPRSGSTMLQRMVGSHSRIFTHPEPHLMTPLAHLGYFHNVEKAPYDHINAAKAMREFVEELPGGEQDYVAACRSYSDALYEGVLSSRDADLFLDKTPAYALVTDFITRLYPEARYVALTRHPLAILSSYANSFFEGDYERAYAFNPILDRYVPAIAGFIRRDDLAHRVHVRYEDVVSDPQTHLRRIFENAGLEHEASAAEYGRFKHVKKSFGDPKVEQNARPVTASVAKWARELAHDNDKLRIAQDIVSGLDPADLATWGYPVETLFEPLEELRRQGGAPPPPPERLNAYRVQRQVLLALRRRIRRDNALGQAIQALRYYCDVLLRD